MSAGVARIDVAAQARRPARRDPVHDPTLRSMAAAILALRSQMPLVPFEDLRDLVPRSLGHLLGARKHSAQRVQRTPLPRSRSVGRSAWS